MALADFDRVARILSLVGITASSNDKKLQPHTYLKETLKNSAPNLLGSSAEISQWLSISKVLTDSRAQSPRILETLDKILKTKSFLVGFSFTIADVAVLESILSQSLDSYPEVARWATLVRSLCHCQSVPQTIYSPTVFPVILKRKSVGNLVTEATPNIAKKDKSEEGKEGKAEKKKEKDVSSKKEKVKEKKSEPECKTESENAGGADADLDPSKLEFRVGLVLKCWEHPEAEKLLCEEIDLGESSGPRRIASGLRAHYSPAEIEGRKVIVLANLKDRNMGMVVCASNADHTVVKLLEPPSCANIGDRVTFDGFGGEPASASALAKKKILEKLLPEMKTNEEGIPMCLSKPFKIGDQVCRSPVPNGNVA